MGQLLWAKLNPPFQAGRAAGQRRITIAPKKHLVLFIPLVWESQQQSIPTLNGLNHHVEPPTSMVVGRPFQGRAHFILPFPQVAPAAIHGHHLRRCPTARRSGRALLFLGQALSCPFLFSAAAELRRRNVFNKKPCSPKGRTVGSRGCNPRDQIEQRAATLTGSPNRIIHTLFDPVRVEGA
jgi:hypothetical protein